MMDPPRSSDTGGGGSIACLSISLLVLFVWVMSLATPNEPSEVQGSFIQLPYGVSTYELQFELFDGQLPMSFAEATAVEATDSAIRVTLADPVHPFHYPKEAMPTAQRCLSTRVLLTADASVDADAVALPADTRQLREDRRPLREDRRQLRGGHGGGHGGHAGGHATSFHRAPVARPFHGGRFVSYRHRPLVSRPVGTFVAFYLITAGPHHRAYAPNTPQGNRTEWDGPQKFLVQLPLVCVNATRAQLTVNVTALGALESNDLAFLSFR